MNISGMPAQDVLNNPFRCHSNNTLVGQNRGKTLEVVVDAPKIMPTISQESPPVQQRSLNRTPGYMPFFRTSETQTIPPTLLGAPVFNAMSSDLRRDDITVNDPEFSSPGVRPKTLTTIVNIFCNSFRNRYSLNTPLIDRSDRVEKVRHRLFSVLTGVLATVSTLAIVLVGLKLSVLLWSLPPVLNLAEHVCYSLLVQFLGVCSAGILIYVCGYLVARLAFIITAVISACMETCEQLSQSNETPQEKFMNKHQRMENQLAHLKELYHQEFHETSCPGGDCPGSVNLNCRADFSLFEKTKKALRQVDLWSDTAMLVFCYDGNKKDIRQALEVAISAIEQWLDNAKRQKDLICNGVEMDSLNNESDAWLPNPIDDGMGLPSGHFRRNARFRMNEAR